MAQKEKGWSKYVTEEGDEYYYNHDTGESSWDCPDELKSHEELSTPSGEWVWLRHQHHGYIPAQVMRKLYGDMAELKTETGEIVQVQNFKSMSTITSMSSLKKIEDDLVHMDAMNEAMIIHNLRERYKKDLIYTNIGTILISVNPFKPLPLYTPAMIDKYWNRGTKELPPHVFNIADAAYKAMSEDKSDQSILISGESGAGKTEATKVVLLYLAEVAGSLNNVEQYILLANPILEAFGNAKTLRNNNSSRFGKWVEILFDDNGKICGAKTVNYLLEKSRVVHQTDGERNYHIFYQLCISDRAKKYDLKGPHEYEYIKTCTNIEGVDDAAEFKEMETAMHSMKFTPQEIDGVFDIIAAILFLGNIKFVSSGPQGSDIGNGAVLEKAASLLKCKSADLKQALTNRTMKIRGQNPTLIPLDPAKASDNRDAFAKALYGNLFDWLVFRLNQCMAPATTPRNTIGVLDIFGFEIFEKNSFEQLCINYANEKLQQNFNQYTFKLEEQLYQQEKINYTHIDFIDNQPTLDLIENKPAGILCLLDEEIVMPKGSDETFLFKLNNTHGKNKHPSFVQLMTDRTSFVVKHYAGDVKYCVDSFLDKNRDTLSEDLFNVSQSSGAPLVKTLFNPESMSSRKMSLGNQFKGQLAVLMNRLNSTQPHYIRCVKPNNVKKPSIFDGAMCLTQLRYAGVFEAVKIRQTGYPFRHTHDSFYKRFRLLFPKLKSKNMRECCMEILKSIKGDFSDVQIGVSRVLYRAPSHRKIELLRSIEMEKAAIKAQKVIRGFAARIIARELKRVRPILRKAMQVRSLNEVNKALDEAKNCSFEMKEITDARALRDVIIEENRITGILEKLVKQDPEKAFDEMQKALQDAEKINFSSALVKQARDIANDVIARRQTKAELIEGAETFVQSVLEAAVKRARELNFLDTMPELRKAKEVLKRIEDEHKVLAELQQQVDSGYCVDREHSTIKTQGLQQAITNCEKFMVKTPEGLQLLAFAKLIFEMRKSLIAEEWDKLGKLVIQASGMKMEDHPEVKRTKEEVLLKAKVDEVTAHLAVAIHDYDHEQLELLLQQAAALEMGDMPVVKKGTVLLENITRARHLLGSAVLHVNEEELIDAVQFCESFGYFNQLVSSARTLRDKVVQLNKDSQEAITVLEKPLMERVVRDAELIKYETQVISDLRTLLFDTPAEKFLQLQLKAAIKLVDKSRVTKITIQIKDIFFDKFAHLFDLSLFRQLRTPTEFSKAKLFGQEALKQGMLKFSKSVIPTSLLKLDPDKVKLAQTMFKNILGFMGDKHYAYPDMLAEDVIASCVSTPEIRDEVYVQLIKQLTANPNKQSEDKGWELMQMCLQAFPPSDQFENFLEMYIRKNAFSQQHLNTLHETLYKNQKIKPTNNKGKIDEMELMADISGNPQKTTDYTPSTTTQQQSVPVSYKSSTDTSTPITEVSSQARNNNANNTSASASSNITVPQQKTQTQTQTQAHSTPEDNAPPPPRQPRKSKLNYPIARALYDYEADEEDILTLKEGDLITVLGQDPSGWWTGELGGKIGLFPGNYTEIVQ